MIKSILTKLFKEEKKSISKEIKVELKGSFGELRQEIRLDRLPTQRYKTLNDIIIPNKEKTTQIDHLVISNYGIFVIENKNFGGSIYGSQYDKNWTQVMGKSKNTFYNPISQNYGHIKSIQDIIGKDKKIYSIIVFSDKSVLKKIETNNSDIKVINEKDLLKTIESFNYKCLSDYEVKDCLNKVLASMGSIKQDKKSHVKNVKDTLEQNSKICPRCKSNLVKRKGQYGEFLGCNSYPKCKYTYKLIVE